MTHQPMKLYRGHGGKVPCILDLRTTCNLSGWFHALATLPMEKNMFNVLSRMFKSCMDVIMHILHDC
jgi:hypothetical protein